MSTVTFENDTIEVIEGDSVLETLLDAGYDIPYSCQAGSCHCCMMQATAGTPPPDAQRGLKETQKQQGFFLACQCRPEEDLAVTLEVSRNTQSAIVAKKQLEPGNVLRLWLKCDLNYRAGQFVNLIRKDGLTRSYSLASVAEIDDSLELHIRIFADGQFSQWASNSLKVGDEIDVEGPFGECYYVSTNPQQPLLLAGTGTGLSPLYGIIRDAIRQQHQGPIYLYTGARSVQSLYLQDELKKLVSEHSLLTYHPVVQDTEGHTDDVLLEGDLSEVVQKRHPDLSGFAVYLCGSEQRVTQLRKQCFLAGASMRDIHVDLFTPAS